MAPINFEENIKDKLERRKLQPTANAWDTLNEKLENNQKKNNKSFWWLGIAATIVGVFLAITFLFNKNNSVEETVVESTNELPADIEVIQEEKTEASKKFNTENEILATQTETQKVKTEVESYKAKPKLNQFRQTKKVQNIADAETIKEAPQKYEQEQVKQLSFEEQKVQEVVAQINEAKENNNEISAEEIDALLNLAQEEIALKKLYNENTKMVDAESLLQDVEMDLEQSFRDKVFEALKTSYKTVKTAVAERNN